MKIGSGMRVGGFAVVLMYLFAMSVSAQSYDEVWNQTLDLVGNGTIYDTAVDSADNVIVTGSLTVKYDSDGNYLWNKTFSTGSNSFGVAVDSADNIVVVGMNNTAWLTKKYDSDGNLLWIQTYSGGFTDSAYGVAIDSEDNILVTGMSFLTSPVFGIMFYTIKYNSSGSVVWSKYYNSGGDDISYAIETDSNDDVLITGVGGEDIITVKYNSSGDYLWNRTYDGGYEDWGTSIAVDSDDNVIVAGRTEVGGTGGSSYWDIITFKFDSDGNDIWNKTYDSGYGDEAFGVAVDSADNIAVAGHAGVDYDWLVMSYDSDGNYLWNQTHDSGGSDSAHGDVFDSADDLIVGGGLNDDYLVIKYTPVVEETPVESSIEWGQVYWYSAETVAHSIQYGIYNSSLACSQTSLFYVEPAPIDGSEDKINASIDQSGSYKCQNATQGAFIISNDGSVGINVSIVFNQITSGVSPKIATSNDGWVDTCSGTCTGAGCDLSADCIELSTSYQQVVYNLAQNASQEMWLWADFDGVAGTSSPTLGNLTTNATIV